MQIKVDNLRHASLDRISKRLLPDCYTFWIFAGSVSFLHLHKATNENITAV